MNSRNDVNSRTKNTFRNIVFGLANKVTMSIIPFVVRTIIIYRLGADYLGLGSLFSSILQVLSVTELGFASAITYTMYEPIAKNDIRKVVEAVGLLKKIYRIIGIVITVIGIAFLPFLRGMIKGDVPGELNLYVLYLAYLLNTVMSYLFYGYKNSILSAYQRNDLISKTGIVVEIITGFIQIAILLLTSNYYAYVFVIPLMTLVSNLIINYTTNHYYPELNVNIDVSLKDVKGIYKQIGGIAIGRISLMCRNSFDSIIISSLIGLTAVAIYSNYYLIFSAVSSFLIIVLTSMAGSVGNCLSTKSMEANERDHITFDFFYEIIVGFCAICLFCLYQPFMNTWVGQDMVFPKVTMILFCFYFYINNLAQIRSVYSEAAGLWWHFKYLTIGEMIANIVLNFGLGIYMGVNGILLATIITAFLGSFVGCSVITYKKLFKKSPMIYFVRNAFYMLVTLIGAFFINRVVENVPIGGVAGLLVKALICGVLALVYLSLVYLTNKRTRDEIITNPLIAKFGRSIAQ